MDQQYKHKTEIKKLVALSILCFGFAGNSLFSKLEEKSRVPVRFNGVACVEHGQIGRNGVPKYVLIMPNDSKPIYAKNQDFSFVVKHKGMMDKYDGSYDPRDVEAYRYKPIFGPEQYVVTCISPHINSN